MEIQSWTLQIFDMRGASLSLYKIVVDSYIHTYRIGESLDLPVHGNLIFQPSAWTTSGLAT